jgi:hypothetical protein
MSSGMFDLARPPVRDAGHGTGRTALVLVTIAAAIRTIRVSTAPCLQTSDDFVAFCLPFSGPHAGARHIRRPWDAGPALW